MPEATHPCPPAFPDGQPNPPDRPLQVTVDPSTGDIVLAPGEAVRVALALTHLAAFAHWSPSARPSDAAVADEAAWMAETLGDHARAGAAPA